ncbi:Transient receptor potential cation channel subfamily M member 3 [Holothuria leucospilota]|uniref:Transient receptor potential cation channel subfamily M member 3 n=1 Tax=Holothuria leucospilota TaxID=206669 RepID=A0A9Q1C1S0_HOLLE|nr:Transient receptor potential cation channel subfamily M member 3 [Holothuria leucospilota]
MEDRPSGNGGTTDSLSMNSIRLERIKSRQLRSEDSVDCWSIVSNSYLSEALAFGTIKFKGTKKVKHNPKARYVVVRDDADPKKVLDVLTDGWRLGKPKLLVNVCGGDENVSTNNQVKELLRHSLLQAAKNIDGWVLTNGFNVGVMKFLGRSLRDFAVSSANRSRKGTFAIGVSDLHSIDQGEKFRQQVSVGNEPTNITYNITDQTQGDENKGFQLNPHHPFFILVDSEDKEMSRNKCNEFRCCLMEEISKLKIYRSTTTIPVVTLAIGGEANSIRVAHRLVTNHSPIVIVAGSGGAADVLEFGYRHMQIGADMNSQNDIILTAGVNQRLNNLCRKGERVELLGLMKTMFRRRLNMSIFHLNGGSIYHAKPSGFIIYDDIVEAIIASLPKGEKGSQLHLAVVWNLLELVKRYFKENKSWKDVELLRSFDFALKNDLTDIIEVFLQQGINLQEFLTRSKLTELYTLVEDDCLFKDLLDKNRVKTLGMITLKLVGRIIKKLTLPDYEPLYCCNEDFTFENPVRELFVWTVLQLRIKTANVLWYEDHAPLGGALFACKLTKAMAELEQDPQQIELMEEHAREYESWAVDILDKYYKEDRRKTSLTIIRELENWGHVSCLCLASSGRMKKIIAHPAVQNLLDEIWSGRIKSNSELKHLICLIFPPACIALLHFRPRIDEQGVAVKHLKHHRLQNLTLPRLPTASQIQSDHVSSPAAAKDRGNRRIFHFSTSFPAEEKVEKPSSFNKMGYFITAPFIIFRYDVISYLIFCALLTYTLLYRRLGEDPSFLEYILMFWVGTLALDEIRQIMENQSKSIRKRILSYLNGYWNMIDLLSISMFAVGTSLRFCKSTRNIAHVILALDLIVFLLRLLHIFSTNRHLGPKLIMILRMFVDLIVFICILAVFLLSYSISVVIIIYPGSERPFTVLWGIIHRAYFQMFGELFLDETDGGAMLTQQDFHGMECPNGTDIHTSGILPCAQNSWFGMLALAFYLFLSNILLLNLLIAMLNFTFQSIQDNCDILWKFQRLGLLKEYYTRPPLPPPFIVLFHIPAFLCYVWSKTAGRCCNQCITCRRKRSFRRKLEENLNEEIAIWESVKGQEFVVTERQKRRSEQVDLQRLTIERFDKIAAELRQLAKEINLKSVEDRLSKIEGELKSRSDCQNGSS